MPEVFTVAFVPGVTPGKWARIWAERMPRRPLEVRPASPDEAMRLLRSGEAQMALLRDVGASETLHVIPLYRETAVVVAPRDHPVAAFDALTVGDLDGETILPGQDAAVVELVAANVGLAVMPQALARALSRKDVVARPLTDAPATSIGLAWPVDDAHPLVDTFVGIVRGRTANSSR
jgi:DNA-binding transcriptional LysR family regulator